MWGFPVFLYKLSFTYGPHLFLLCLETVLCPLRVNIPSPTPLPPLSPSLVLFLFSLCPWFSVFVPSFLLFLPLGQINFLCAQNLGCLVPTSRSFLFSQTLQIAQMTHAHPSMQSHSWIAKFKVRGSCPSFPSSCETRPCMPPWFIVVLCWCLCLCCFGFCL